MSLVLLDIATSAIVWLAWLYEPLKLSVVKLDNSRELIFKNLEVIFSISIVNCFIWNDFIFSIISLRLKNGLVLEPPLLSPENSRK